MAGSFSSRRLRALFTKEMLQVLRDPSTILIAVFFPIMLVFLFGYGVSLDTSVVKLGLLQQSGGSASLSLASAYVNSPYFDVKQSNDKEALFDDLTAGRIRGIVTIPADFDRRYAATRKTAKVQIITDGSNPSTANFVSAYAQGVHAQWLASESVQDDKKRSGGIQVLPQFWYNTALTSRNFLVPGSFSVILTMIGSLLTALVVAREWERGTMEALIATPVTIPEFIITKMVPYFILGLITATICTLMAVFIFDVPFRGSILALYALYAAFLMPALGQGLLISAALKNQFVASQVALLTGFLPAFLLSGFIFEISSMPKWIQVITYAVPARYLIPPLQSLFLTGNVWALLLPNIAILLGFGALFFILIFRVTKKTLD
ncbi:MAG: ABC transporter permease [Parasphingorhabdus sp.]|uniref:ABC transporter permease n=1 Tax=Parasphingorhabdus sp. TaxID=2709688 RepID=UPI003001AE9E